MEVISLEKDRVILKENMVIKKTNQKELSNLIYARKQINGASILIDEECYNVVVPEVYDFIDDKIVMEKCYGDNVEIMLRNKKKHSIGVKYTNQILKEFIRNSFFWKDYAPRNVLINENNISIMDFERGIDDNNTQLFNYFLDSVYEEYSAFLLPKERLFKMDEVFKYDNVSIISINDIKSKRIKTILKKLGYVDIIPFDVYVLAVKMIIVNETPYLKDNEIFYPLIELENYIVDKGYENYANRIIEGYYEKVRSL